MILLLSWPYRWRSSTLPSKVILVISGRCFLTWQYDLEQGRTIICSELAKIFGWSPALPASSRQGWPKNPHAWTLHAGQGILAIQSRTRYRLCPCQARSYDLSKREAFQASRTLQVSFFRIVQPGKQTKFAAIQDLKAARDREDGRLYWCGRWEDLLQGSAQQRTWLCMWRDSCHSRAGTDTPSSSWRFAKITV